MEVTGAQFYAGGFIVRGAILGEGYGQRIVNSDNGLFRTDFIQQNGLVINNRISGSAQFGMYLGPWGQTMATCRCSVVGGGTHDESTLLDFGTENVITGMTKIAGAPRFLAPAVVRPLGHPLSVQLAESVQSPRAGLIAAAQHLGENRSCFGHRVVATLLQRLGEDHLAHQGEEALDRQQAGREAPLHPMHPAQARR